MSRKVKIPDDSYMCGHKLKIYPSDDQKSILNVYIDQYRFVYNWGIEMERKRYQEYLNKKSEFGFYYYIDLYKLFIEYKKSLDWLILPIHECCNALMRVENNYMRYFEGIIKKPKYKSKKTCKASFSIRVDGFYVNDNDIKIEMQKGTPDHLRHISLGFNSEFTKDNKYYKPYITREDDGSYWVSFCTIEKKKSINMKYNEAIGVDVGIRNTMTTSKPIDGEYYHHQPWNKVNKLTSKIKRLDKQISKDKKRRERTAQSLSDKTGTRVKASQIPKSKRELKREEERRKAYKTLHNIKDTYYHTKTKQIVTSGYIAVGIEDIEVRNLQKENIFNTALSSVSMYTIRKYIEYKGQIYNVPIHIVDTNYPSSQICSCCGIRNDIGSKKIYSCPICGNVMDRDLNAAMNLESEALKNFWNLDMVA